MGSEKMSKSLGNVKLIHDLLKDWDGEVIRLALLKAHYRSELVWNEKLLEESKAQLDDWYRIKRTGRNSGVKLDDENYDFIATFGSDYFRDFLLSDMAIPNALMALSKQRKDIATNRFVEMKNEVANQIHYEGLEYCANLLGLLEKDPETWFKGGASSDEEAEFDAIALRRQEARATKDWAAADAARDEATAKGIVLEDGPDGTSWRKA